MESLDHCSLLTRYWTEPQMPRSHPVIFHAVCSVNQHSHLYCSRLLFTWYGCLLCYRRFLTPHPTVMSALLFQALRYVAASWWDPQLDTNRRPQYKYTAQTDMWDTYSSPMSSATLRKLNHKQIGCFRISY